MTENYKKIVAKFDFKKRAHRNLGTFNTHCMNAEAENIFNHYSSINGVDEYVYSELKHIKQTCAEFMLNLFHAKNLTDFNYVTTSGSSEAILLALLALKQRNTKNSNKYNFIIGENRHVSWLKAADFLGIQLRVVKGNNPRNVLNYIDENTVGVGCVIGATTTLLFDDIEKLNTLLEQYYQKTKHFIPMHVDAASGGFVAPFQYPSLRWDFQLSHVFSINVSSHKYGLVYPSLGWLFMRSTSCLPQLTHCSDYLGESANRISIQFSHSAAHLMTQYYHFQTLGISGYQKIVQELYELSAFLREALIEMPEINNLMPENTPSLPGVVFNTNDGSIAALSNYLKQKDWYIPVYQLPSNQQSVARIVIRNGFDESEMRAFIGEVKAYFSKAQSRHFKLSAAADVTS